MSLMECFDYDPADFWKDGDSVQPDYLQTVCTLSNQLGEVIANEMIERIADRFPRLATRWERTDIRTRIEAQLSLLLSEHEELFEQVALKARGR